jgi:hypothetical protein
VNVSIDDGELCAVLCALGEAGAAADQLAQALPQGAPERQVLLDTADGYQSLATALMYRAAAQDDARYPTAAAAAWEAGLRTGYRYPIMVPA